MMGADHDADRSRSVARGRAVELLRQAEAHGYRNIAEISREPAFDSIRSRPDFKLLMMDLAIPVDPFASAN
jgi:hypothetical protein